MTKKKYKAIIFDFDGVLVNSEPRILDTILFVLKKEGIKISKKEFLENNYKNIAGSTTNHNYKYLKDTFNLKLNLEKYLDLKAELRMKIYETISLMPYTRDFLKKLSENYTMDIATSSDKWKMDIFFKRFPFLERYMSALITNDNIKKSKPDPEIFLKAAEALGVKPNEAIVIEDSLNGLKAAKAGGFDCIIVKNPFLEKEDYLPLKPLAIVTKTKDILNYL
jgi:beta-phosphoglucomutase